MRHCTTLNEELFIKVSEGDHSYRFVLFEWITGKHITHCTETIVEKFSYITRRIHDISSKYESVDFPKKSHLEGYTQFLDMIVKESNSSQPIPSILQEYINVSSYHLEKAKSDSLEYIIQSDLNPLNILWSDKENIIGIVDFESITYTDRVEGLAWLIKWYSSTKGIGFSEMSSSLAQTVLRGYGANELLSTSDFKRLPSLLWLSGCLNWNFTAKTIELLHRNEDDFLTKHLKSYFNRGEALTSLV